MADFMSMTCMDADAAEQFAADLLDEDIMVGEVAGRVVTVPIGSVGFIAYIGYRAMQGRYAHEKDANTAVALAMGETVPD